MALYLLPTQNNGHVERPSRTLAILGSAAEDVLAIPEPHTASDLGRTESFTEWKALQVERIKGVMRRR